MENKQALLDYVDSLKKAVEADEVNGLVVISFDDTKEVFYNSIEGEFRDEQAIDYAVFCFVQARMAKRLQEEGATRH